MDFHGVVSGAMEQQPLESALIAFAALAVMLGLAGTAGRRG